MITHESLIDICQEIGTVAESNVLFTRGLVAMMDVKTIETLTVAELLQLIDQRRADYNRIYSRQVCDE